MLNQFKNGIKQLVTNENHYTLKVDEDFAGSITVQIVSRRDNSSKVKSLLNKDATVRVGSKEDQ